MDHGQTRVEQSVSGSTANILTDIQLYSHKSVKCTQQSLLDKTLCSQYLIIILLLHLQFN